MLSSGLWHPGCDVGEDIPLAREIEDRLDELEVIEPRREKTGLRGFRPGPTQTGLYKLRKELEA